MQNISHNLHLTKELKNNTMLFTPCLFIRKYFYQSLFPVLKDYIMQMDYFFVENEKTARKVVKFFAPEKKNRLI